MGLEAGIWVLRLESGSCGWNLGHEAAIWFLTLRGGGKQKKVEEKKEKFSHMWKHGSLAPL